MSFISTISTAFSLLSLLTTSSTNGVVNGQMSVINIFEENLISGTKSPNQKTPPLFEFSPPSSINSTYKWASRPYGPCFGCGTRSYKTQTHDCIHRVPMQLSVGAYSKSLIGNFKVSDSECTSRAIQSPPSVNSMGCGPPCSELRLLRGDETGCRCDHQRKLAYEVPHLTCQNNRNKTVSLTLCKFFYEKNTLEYQAAVCDYSIVCGQGISWIAGNWSVCSHENLAYQKREILCVAKSPEHLGEVYYKMHASMCANDLKPAMIQACAKWTAERIFKCNCATKTATRRMICARGRRQLKEEECNWHAKPPTSRPCTDKQIQDCNAQA